MLAALVFGCALVLAIAVLYLYHAKSWYWHLLSIALALTLGFLPPLPEAWRGTVTDLITGCLFLFLFVWGLGGLILYRRHHPKHA